MIFELPEVTPRTRQNNGSADVRGKPDAWRGQNTEGAEDTEEIHREVHRGSGSKSPLSVLLLCVL